MFSKLSISVCCSCNLFKIFLKLLLLFFNNLLKNSANLTRLFQILSKSSLNFCAICFKIPPNLKKKIKNSNFLQNIHKQNLINIFSIFFDLSKFPLFFFFFFFEISKCTIFEFPIPPLPVLVSITRRISCLGGCSS